MDDLFGIFFEDLNHAADGGLYAELVQNRSFEFCEIDNPKYHSMTAWEKIENDGKIRLQVETGHAFCEKNPHYLVMEVVEPGEDIGVCNLGYNSGISLKKGERYHYTCYAKSRESAPLSLHISLRGDNGNVLSSEQTVELTREWTKYEKTLYARADTNNGRLAVTLSGCGTAEIDFVSLFPADTYKGRKNGLRRDLAELLEEMHPRFMRFPGGCLIHDGTLDPEDRGSQYRWKNSVGPVEERPAKRNSWKYNQTLGLGYYEYFQFCEDIGAKPLPVLPGGFDPHHQRAAVGDVLKEYVQDALDLVEFANGGTDTRWGTVRTSMGHPEPFGLEYIGIGNEEIGEEFFERYPYFHKAVKDRYPEIKIIGTSGPFAAGEEYEKGWQSARENKADLVDEHYYQSPQWFLANYHHYDDFPKEGPKVFLGEYASQNQTWFNALAEAAYMTGLQNNAGAVGLACYAPMLCNVDYVNWRPDMIWFDNHRVFGTPSYYIQKLFMNHQGDVTLKQTITREEKNIIQSEDPETLPGHILLASNDAVAEYTDIVVTDEVSGAEFEYPDLVIEKEQPPVPVTRIESKEYTIQFKAKEIDGLKGFQIFFGNKDEKNQLFWKIGGWENTDSMICEEAEGQNSVLTQKKRSVEPGRVYDMKIHVCGRQVTTYVDGEEELSVTVKPLVIEPAYVSASLDEATGDVIIKMVNAGEKSTEMEFQFEGTLENGWCGNAYIMEGHEKKEENSFENPCRVIPSTKNVLFSSKNFNWSLPEASVCILRLNQGTQV